MVSNTSTTLYTIINAIYYARNCKHHDDLPTIFSVRSTDENVPQKLHASKQVPVVIVRNRSCPAVSQICSLMRFPSSSMVRILKSILPNATNQELRINTTRQKTFPTLQSAKWLRFFEGHTLLWWWNLLWRSHQKIEGADKIFQPLRIPNQTLN